MASVKITKPYDKKDSANTEMRVVISGTKSGASYEFIVTRRHIEVVQIDGIKPSQAHSKRVDTDWFDKKALTDQEKVQLFAVIMDQYRERSHGDNGFRGAAIGVVPVKDKKGQSRLFIGTNTMRWASPYFKDCAETNMVNSATDRLAFEQAQPKKGVIAAEAQAITPAQLSAIYIMQGISEDEKPMACACGKCTDMLANGVMVDKKSPVIIIPLLTKVLRKSIGENTNLVDVNTSAQTMDEIVPPKKSGKLTAWQKSIDALNHDRVIDLNGKMSNQEAMFEAFMKKALGAYGLPEAEGRANQVAIDTWATKHHKALPEPPMARVEAILELIKHNVRSVTQKIKTIVLGAEEAANKAVENIILHRKSEATLDCAVRANGTVDLARMNAFLVGQISDAFADRTHVDAALMKLSPKQKLANAPQNIRFIRCVVIQLDDGTFHYAVQAEGKYDKAMPNAEAVALENAVCSLARHGVRHVWAMELNPDDIANNRMHTSPKEGVERLAKRASSKGLDFTFIPFNSGVLSHEELAAAASVRQQNQLYPGGHNGVQTAEKSKAQGGTRHARA